MRPFRFGRFPITLIPLRTDGEIFWIIENGSLGTGMQALVPAMLSEEEAWKIVAYVRSFCKTQM